MPHGKGLIIELHPSMICIYVNLFLWMNPRLKEIIKRKAKNVVFLEYKLMLVIITHV
jgi:hypothetical protein